MNEHVKTYGSNIAKYPVPEKQSILFVVLNWDILWVQQTLPPTRTLAMAAACSSKSKNKEEKIQFCLVTDLPFCIP